MGPPVNTDGDAADACEVARDLVASMGPPVNTDGDAAVIYDLLTGGFGLQWGRR